MQTDARLNQVVTDERDCEENKDEKKGKIRKIDLFGPNSSMANP